MGISHHARDRCGYDQGADSTGERASLAALLGGTCGEKASTAAEALLARFGTIADVLHASADAIRTALPNGGAVAEQLGHVRAAMSHALRKQLHARPVLSNEAALVDYLTFTMAHRQTEVIRLLLLDTRNGLIRDEVLGMGSVGSVALHPREPVRRALELGATALILVHNHPSGDPTPSAADIDATRRLAAAAALMDIRVHDHMIVARGGWVSLRRMGLLS